MTAVLGAAGWLLVCLCILAAMWWWDARQERRDARRRGYLDSDTFAGFVEPYRVEQQREVARWQ